MYNIKDSEHGVKCLNVLVFLSLFPLLIKEHFKSFYNICVQHLKSIFNMRLNRIRIVSLAFQMMFPPNSLVFVKQSLLKLQLL